MIMANGYVYEVSFKNDRFDSSKAKLYLQNILIYIVKFTSGKTHSDAMLKNYDIGTRNDLLKKDISNPAYKNPKCLCSVDSRKNFNQTFLMELFFSVLRAINENA